MSPIPLGILAASLKKAITDAFNRTTSGTLGTADSGQVWANLRGTWFANGSKATTATAASSYPIASVQASTTNTTTSASVTSGTGVAFWIADSGSWWASTSYNSSQSYTYQCNPHTGYWASCNWTCANGTSAGATVTQLSSPTTCAALASDWCSTLGYGGVTSSSGTTGSSTYYDTCTGYNYYYNLRLIKSVVGTVSQVVSDVSLASQPAAIKVVTFGDTITAQAYADEALTSPLGSAIVTTPSSPNKGTSVGIIVAPSDYQQAAIVDNFSAVKQ